MPLHRSLSCLDWQNWRGQKNERRARERGRMNTRVECAFVEEIFRGNILKKSCFTVGKIFAATWKLLGGATHLRFVSIRGANIGLLRLPILFARPCRHLSFMAHLFFYRDKDCTYFPCAPFCLFTVHPRDYARQSNETIETSRRRERGKSQDFTFVDIFFPGYFRVSRVAFESSPLASF